ncbi:MAG: tetratricopeptide repeat protein, partial [Acidobacteriota bacterium]
GFGDCKDKHALLSALLRAAGFETAGVLVNAGRAPSLGVPTQLHFNHIITRVELEDGPLWLDSTAVAPAGYLAPALRGARGLLVPATGEPRLVEMPEELLSGSSLELTRTALIDDDGTLRSDDVLQIRGDYEVLMRAAMLTMDPDQWRQVAPAFAGGLGLESAVESPQFSDAMAIEAPLEIRYGATSEAFLEGVGEVEVKVPLPALPLTSSLAEREDGRLSLDGIPPTTLSVELGLPHTEAVTVPSPVELDYENFAFSAEYRVEDKGDGVRVVTAVKTLRPKVIALDAAAASEYQAFRRAVRSEERRKITVTLTREVGAEAEDSGAELTESAMREAVLGAVEEKEWARAESLARRLTEQHPESASSWALLADTLRAGGKEPESLGPRERVIEIDRFFLDAYFELGTTLWNVDRQEDAVAALREQLEIDPFHAGARSNLGRLLGLRDGDCDEIVPLLSGHDDSTFAYDWVLTYLTICLYQQGRAEDAAETFELLRFRDDTEALEWAAWSLREKERRGEALTLYRRIRELDADHPDIHRSIGWTLEQMGDLEAAESAYREQIRVDPTNAYAGLDLSRIAFNTDGRGAAIRVLEEAADRTPDNLEVLRYLGLHYFDTADPDRARGPLEKVHAAEPEDFDVNRALGLVAARQGRNEAAVRYLEKAKALDAERFADQDMLDYVRSNLGG